MANRGAPRQAADPMARLAELLETALNTQPRDRFKPPKFDGKSDVELFITQFQEVSAANQWDQATALINLRLALERDATKCGRGQDMPAIFANLRARFGLTVRQARDKLAHIRREPGQTNHMLGLEIQKLVRLAYPTMGANDQTVIAIETFKKSVDNKQLSRHLLAIPADTVETVTAAADAFFQAGQITMTNNRNRANINHIEIEPCDEEEHKINSITTKLTDPTAELLTKLLAAVEQNTAIVADLVKQGRTDRNNVRFARSRSNSRERGKLTQTDECYQCGSNSHYVRDCPQKSENLPGPQ